MMELKDWHAEFNCKQMRFQTYFLFFIAQDVTFHANYSWHEILALFLMIKQEKDASLLSADF